MNDPTLHPRRALPGSMALTLALLLGAPGLATAQVRKKKTPPPPPPVVKVVAPAPLPAAAAAAPAPVPAAPPASGIEDLRQEYLALRAEIFRSRAQLATLGQSLYGTKVQLRFRNKAGRFYDLRKLDVLIDGAGVASGRAGEGYSEVATLHEGFVGAGRHEVTVRAQFQAKGAELFRFTLDNTFSFEAIKGRRNEITLVADEDGDIFANFPKRQRGDYVVKLRAIHNTFNE
jgi:hypothetical protein